MGLGLVELISCYTFTWVRKAPPLPKLIPGCSLGNVLSNARAF